MVLPLVTDFGRPTWRQSGSLGSCTMSSKDKPSFQDRCRTSRKRLSSMGRLPGQAIPAGGEPVILSGEDGPADIGLNGFLDAGRQPAETLGGFSRNGYLGEHDDRE